jgi:hypothetical protein
MLMRSQAGRLTQTTTTQKRTHGRHTLLAAREKNWIAGGLAKWPSDNFMRFSSRSEQSPSRLSEQTAT